MTSERPRQNASPSRAMSVVSASVRDGIHRYIARRAPPAYVDDMVQDVMLRMHERVGELRDDTRLTAWAFSIAHSVVIDFYRAKKKNGESADPDALQELEALELSLDDANMNEVVASWLRPMIALLPKEYEEALELTDLGGLTQREYAERVGLSLSGAKTRVQRARRMLQELVEACCDLELDPRGNIIGYQRRNCSNCGC